MKTALVAGGTGLIGTALIDLLLQSDRYDVVKAVTRSALAKDHPKLKAIPVDFTRLEDYRDQLAADDVFCCLGTTMAKARTKEKFRQVDFTFPLALAGTTLASGAGQFLLVSALGADKRASIFYNRVKGETEDAVSGTGFECVHIFRPSLLLGPRTESRPAEEAAKIFYKLFGFLIPARYKAIEATRVARAMILFASLEQEGRFVHESKEMLDLK